MESSATTCDPLPLAMVLCDNAYRDRGTGKYTLNGLFSTVTSERYPAVHRDLTVYIAVTEVYGDIDVQVRMVDVDEAEGPLVTIDGQMSSEDPRAVAETTVTFGAVPLPRPGEYRVQLFADGNLIAERRLYAREVADGE